MNRQCEILIAGAGVAGLTVALLLAKLPRSVRPRVSIIDAQPEPQPTDENSEGLRVSAMSAGSMRIFEDLGVADLDGLRACPYREMRVWDAMSSADSPEAIVFSAAELALPELGYIVDDGLLRASLRRQLAGTGIAMQFGTGITGLGFDNNRCRCLTANGGDMEADLLIAADGTRSAVRDLAGIGTDSWKYPQAALVAHARPALDHRHTAWQRFLPDGPLALLPLCDGRISLVWSTTREHAAALLSAGDDEFGSALTDASDRVLGALTPASGRASFPLQAQHAKQYVSRGIALIGDSAHTVHPLAGQGANLGVADAAALAETIASALAADEWPADLPVLRRYERVRRGANGVMLGFVDGLNRLFSGGGRLDTLRVTGMRIFNRSGPLKRRAMRVATGL